MISLSSINGEYEYLPTSDSLIALESVIDRASNEVDDCVSSYLKIHEDYMFESQMFGSLNEEKTLFLESEKDSVFKKIGEKTIEIFKKFKEFATKAISKIKEIGFSSKSDVAKLQKLIKEHPELKDEVICAYKQGDLNVADAKTLKELDAAFDEIVKLSKQKDVKPDTLRGKVEAMKKKFKNIDQSTVIKAAAATTTVITAATAVIKLRKMILDSQKDSVEYMKKYDVCNEDIQKAIKEMKEKHGDEYVSDSLSKAQILTNAYIWMGKETGKLISKEQGKAEKLNKGITAFIAKHIKDKSKDYVDASVSGAERSEKREEKEKEKALNKAREEAREKSYGNEEGKNKYRANNKDEIRRNKREDSFDMEQGKLNFKRANKDELRRSRREDSFDTEQGRLNFKRTNKDEIDNNTINDSYYKRAGAVDYDYQDYDRGNGSKLRYIDNAKEQTKAKYNKSKNNKSKNNNANNN